MEKKEEKIEKNTNINELDALLLIEQVVFGLNNENFNQYVKYIISQFDEIHTSSFNLLLIQMMYLNFSVKMSDPKTYFNLIKQISKYHISLNKEKKTSIYVMFLIFLCIKDTQASHYLLYYMVESHFINPKITQKNKFKSLPIFAHYNSIEDIKKFFYVKFMNQIIYNYEELSNNGWELHKKFIEEGHNPNEIAKIIRNDEIEKLQEISSQNNFDFNQIIEPSLYERCSFINEENVSLIDYAAFFSSIKCFKYLLMNNANVKNAGKYAVAGGNIEIIHLCEQNHSTFDDAYETTIKFHKNEIFYYLYENNFPDSTNLVKLGKFCVLYHNYEIFTFLLKEGMEVNDDIINESARNGNLYLTRYFCKKYQIPKNILIFSSESNNNELFIYTLKQKGVDINAKDIYLFYFKFILII